MRIAICDDCEIMTGQLIKLVNAYSGFDRQIQIKMFSTGNELLDCADREDKFDIVFMDIRLGEKELGYEVGVALKDIPPQTLIIYMSSFRGYADDVNNAEPLMFLTKPLSQDGVNKALDRAMKRIGLLYRKYYTYRYNSKTLKVDLLDVILLESGYKQVYVKTKNNEVVILAGRTGKKLPEIYKEVEAIHPVFCQASQTRFFNALYVDKIQRTSVEVSGKTIKIHSDFHAECMEKCGIILKTYKY